MHVGFLTPEYVTARTPEGGLANYLHNVGGALAKLGHDVSVFVLSNRDESWKDGQIAVYEVRRAVLPKCLTVHRFHRVVAQVLSSRRLRSAVWKIHRATPFDILQASSYQAPGYPLRRNGRVPLVCRISSYTPLWRSAYGRKRNLGEYLSDWLEIRQVLDAEASFAPSDFVATTFARLEACEPQVIRTPVHLPDISTDRSFYADHLAGTSYLLFFGTLSRIKGVDLLASVIPPLLERHKDLVFVFIGRDDGLPGGQTMFDYISSQCSRFQHRLHYHSPLPKTQLYPVIANALGVVMPSRVDNYPNACLEAHALGVPVVGTYDSSLDEMIADGETGFLARNGDPVSLRDAVQRLIAMRAPQRRQMQEHILDSVRSISREDRIGQLVSFYEAVIREFHRAS